MSGMSDPWVFILPDELHPTAKMAVASNTPQVCRNFIN